MKGAFLTSVIFQLEENRNIAEKTFGQLKEEDFFWKQNEESNSIAAIIRHMSGNMLSRWTDFLTTDGEKPWRKRDAEFEDGVISKESLMGLWNEGWTCLFDALNQLQNEDLEKTIFIRSKPLSVVAAINRQLAHYSYHIGQLVYIGKLLRGSSWKALTIPKNKSSQFNEREMKKSKKE